MSFEQRFWRGLGICSCSYQRAKYSGYRKWISHQPQGEMSLVYYRDIKEPSETVGLEVCQERSGCAVFGRHCFPLGEIGNNMTTILKWSIAAVWIIAFVDKESCLRVPHITHLVAAWIRDNGGFYHTGSRGIRWFSLESIFSVRNNSFNDITKRKPQVTSNHWKMELRWERVEEKIESGIWDGLSSRCYWSYCPFWPHLCFLLVTVIFPKSDK